MRLRLLLLVSIVGLNVIVAVSGSPRSFAVEQPTGVPAWLQAHVGEGEGQIAQVVLQRARALYLKKVSEGTIKNPCYFAMDATRPGGFARRFTFGNRLPFLRHRLLSVRRDKPAKCCK